MCPNVNSLDSLLDGSEIKLKIVGSNRNENLNLRLRSLTLASSPVTLGELV